MERQPCGTVGVFKSGKVSCRTIEKLGAGYKANRRSIKEHKKAV